MREPQTTIVKVEQQSRTFKLLLDFLEAYKERTKAWSGDDNADNSQVLTTIKTLERKVDTMSSNIERIEKEAADAAENARLIRAAVEDLKLVAEGMKTEITALKDQLAQGQLDQARLAAAATVFEQADNDTDAVLASLNPSSEPETPAVPAPEEGGTTP